MKAGFLSTIALAVLSFTSASNAQVNEQFADLTSEIEMLRSLARAERQLVVTDSMQLTPGEAQAFWPVYHQYRADSTKVNDRLVKLITDYAANHETLDDAKAKSLLNDMLTLQGDTVALRRKYVSRFSKVLPAKKVARLYQIENKLDAVQNLVFARDVPLAR